jgi:hypothetical protein
MLGCTSARADLSLAYRELGKHRRDGRSPMLMQVKGQTIDRCSRLVTAVNRPLGHVGGTAGEDEADSAWG